MSHVQASICLEDDVSQGYRIVDDYMHQDHDRASLNDRAEVISKSYDNGRLWYRKQIVDMLQGIGFALNRILETLKDLKLFISFVHETGNEKVNNDFRKLLVFIRRTTAARVSNVYKKNIVQVL